jgi:hypothetical protein
MRLAIGLSCALVALSATRVCAEETKHDDRVERALASKAWRVPRVIVLPIVAAATSVGAYFGIAVSLSSACSGQIGGDYLGPCGLLMLGAVAAAHTFLVPAVTTLVGALMKARGNYFIALAGSASAMLLAVASAFVAVPVSFAFPMFTGMVLAPLGSVIAYEISAAREENRALDSGSVVLPSITPLRDGVALGLSITNW